MKREDKIKKLREKIDLHIKNGGSIYDGKKDIPYYSYMIDFIKKDRLIGITSTVESLYNECGYEYTSRKKEVTLERIKEEIDKFVKNGGDIYDKKEHLPYYELIGSFIRKYPNNGLTYKKIYELCGYEYSEKMHSITIERLKQEIDEYIENGGDIYKIKDNKSYYSLLCSLVSKYKKQGYNYNMEDVMRLCGYEYLNPKRNNYRLFKLFENIRDESGYIDRIKESDEGKKVLYAVQDRAKNKGVSVNEYLMCFFGVRLSNSFRDVDYVVLVENDLKSYEKKYGYYMVNHKDIKNNDTRLLYRIEHLAKYFPCGSITFSQVLNFFGYDVEVSEKKEIDEADVINRLCMLFPDREIYGLTKFELLYDKVIRLSTKYDMTVQSYLKNKGFNMVVNKNVYRLSKVKQDNDDEFYKRVCNIRDDLIKKSKIMNDMNSTQSDFSDEIDLIGEKALKKIKMLEKRIKR